VNNIIIQALPFECTSMCRPVPTWRLPRKASFYFMILHSIVRVDFSPYFYLQICRKSFWAMFLNPLSNMALLLLLPFHQPVVLW
jgi:hypothetical protein